jgi:hypothetical protein
LWVFDDGRAIDAAYRMDVLDRAGRTWSARLENVIPFNSHGHEIEGFIGVFSPVPIAAITLTPIDPATGQPVADDFAVDHLIIGDRPPRNSDGGTLSPGGD